MRANIDLDVIVYEVYLSQSQITANSEKKEKDGYFLRAAIKPLHLSAYWQYWRHTAFSSGRFHSAPQLGQVVLSSSLQISSSPPQT